VGYNDEQQWRDAQNLLERMDLVKPTTRSMYTNDIWRKAVAA